MSIIVSNCQHCDEQQFQTLMFTLHEFLSSKIRFIHTSTVTESHSCSGKNYAYDTRTSCQYFVVKFHKITISNACVTLLGTEDIFQRSI